MNTKTIALGILTLSALFNPLAGKDRSAAEKRRAERRASAAPFKAKEVQTAMMPEKPFRPVSPDGLSGYYADSEPGSPFRQIQSGSPAPSEHTDSGRATASPQASESEEDVLPESMRVKMNNYKAMLQEVQDKSPRLDLLQAAVNTFMKDLQETFNERREIVKERSKTSSASLKKKYTQQMLKLENVNLILSEQILAWIDEVGKMIKNNLKTKKQISPWMAISRGSLTEYSVSLPPRR
ncbi:MAG: hypothetical protein CMM87_03375 [Rickettsiales bacterium]|nr:hypothetical protein [Rickettsiales bacterium]|tara:strand:+ start:13914 stop:14627 length:714 start_codon:yes stop_codon:yes gene_type:complete